MDLLIRLLVFIFLKLCVEGEVFIFLEGLNCLILLLNFIVFMLIYR